MGTGRSSVDDWKTYSSSVGYDTKTREEIFSDNLDKDLDPKNIKLRESRDSAANPRSTPIIVAADETGSMGNLAEVLIKHGFSTLITEIYSRKPVSDPHIMCMGIGDAETDKAPLQVTQFETEASPLFTQVEKIYLEGNGGGNSYEGYSLAWLFAALKTRHDSFEKRGKKGYLFTMGDELPTPRLRASDLTRIFGASVIEGDEIKMSDLLTMVSREWEVFHLVVAEGNYARQHGPQNVLRAWNEVLGQRAVLLEDSTKMAEVIVSIIQVAEGASADDVVASWDGKTGLVVRAATKSLSAVGGASAGVVTL